jgi:hypothetical protein
VTLVPFGVIALTRQNYAVGMPDLALALLLTMNLLHARRYRNYDFNVRFGITLAAFLLVYAFLTGGINGTGFVCYYAFPLIACFFLGSKKGAVAVGLAICQRIVERHGGYIWVDSELGKGAAFYFTLSPGKAELATS